MSPQLNKLPFWLADAMLLAAAGCLVGFGARPLRIGEMLAVAGCAALGGWLATLPYLKEYDAEVKLAEADRLKSATASLVGLENVAERISGATEQWQGIQDRAQETARLAQEVVDRLAREAAEFASAVTRTADGEKQTLKLELEKLRRAETDWLQVVGRIMDHTFALHLAALRSGKPGVTEQIERFHAACREALRRVGFTAMVSSPDEPFDPRRHQTADGSTPPDGALIDETVAPGFTFQGRLLRPVIVRVVGSARVAQTGEQGDQASLDAGSGSLDPSGSEQDDAASAGGA
jgi:molecular chaperone GrpE (heat shock protein)